MKELWGSLSVNDHVRRRALVAQVLLFDRLVIPVPPDGDTEQERRWAANGWKPERQRRMLDILGVAGGGGDLAVPIPWTRSKRERFGQDRARLVSALRFDASNIGPDVDPYAMTRILLTREHDDREMEYQRRLPQVWVEKVVPAYGSFVAANRELGLHAVAGPAPPGSAAQVIGWELLVPEDSDWSDDHALEAAAALARTDDYRMEREVFRDWWKSNVGEGMPAQAAVRELVRRAERINQITRGRERRTRLLRGFAAMGATAGLAGAWLPPAAIAGGVIALVSLGADWVLKDEAMPAALGPAAMFTDARKHLGWR